jgi:carbonic anhydrase
MVARLALSVFAVLPLLGSRSALAQAEARHPWSYEGAKGPAHWGELKSEYAVCKTGKHQSPIDIRNEKPADLPAIEFSYAPTPFRIIDNGHSVQVNVDPGNSISVGGKRYDLVQFHFHHPSEERIHGKSYPMVAHLVHKDADGKLAVVAVLLKSGHQNPFIEALWKDLPADEGQEHAPQGARVDLGQLLPANRGYYTFTGSLTTPPCSEDVTWFVLKQPVEISKPEQAAFATKYAHNARPVQPLNGRAVQASK